MTFGGLIVSVFIPFVVKYLAVFDICLIEKIGVSDSDPVQSRFFVELRFKFSLKVLVHRRLHTLVGSDGSREQAHIVKHVRILLGDVH